MAVGEIESPGSRSGPVADAAPGEGRIRPHDLIDLVYITSPSFSGSTLLTYLLGCHPAVATIGELKWSSRLDPQTYLCSCGIVLERCPFWQEVQARMSRLGAAFDLRRPPTDFRCPEAPWSDRVLRARVRSRWFERLRHVVTGCLPTARRTRDEVAEFNRKIMRTILEVQQARVFVDGSKEPVRVRYLQQAGGFRIRLIHLVRDGRGVMFSHMKNKSFSPEVGAWEWRTTHEQVERLASYIPPADVLRVCYEDLCRDPEARMREILQFIGLDADRVSVCFRSVEQHILGNRMRLESSGEIKLDEKWRSALTREQMAVFERMAGPANRKYGYE